MAKREILAGATDQTIDVFLEDVNGSPITALVYNSTGLTCYYRKGATGAATALSLATQTVAGAHSDGGFVLIDNTNMPGVYRLDLSDTIVATAGMSYLVLNGYAGMAPCVIELEVVAVDKFNATNFGLSLVPANVTQLSGDSTAADNAEAFFDGTGYAGTNNVIPTVTSVTGVAAGGITATSIADSAIDRATFAVDTGLRSVRSNTAQSATGTTIVLDAGASAVDDFYNNSVIYITGGTGVGQARSITDYVGSTLTATVATWATNPDATSTFAILADSASSGGSGGATAAQVWEYTTRTLTGGTVTVTSPAVSVSRIEMLAGYDYTDNAGQSLQWAFTDAPDLTGATVDIVKVDTSETSYGWTVTVSGTYPATQTVKAEVTSAMTLALATAGQKVTLAFRIKATLSNGAQRVLAEGVMTIS